MPHQLPPFSPAGVWSWTWDPPVLALAVGLAALYVAGVRGVHRRGLTWPWGRSLAFGLGILSALAVTVTGAGNYAGVLLSVFTVQVLVLLLLTPVLLLYGRPLALAADGGGSFGRRAAAVTTRGPVRVLMSPVVGPLLVPVVLAVCFFSPVLAGTLQHAALRDLLQVVLVCVGLLLALGLVGDGTESKSALALGGSAAIGLVELVVDAVPGIVVRLQTHLLPPLSWAGLHRTWAPSPLVDQQHAGAILWFVAEAADLPFLVIVVRRWIRADEREAIAEDHAVTLSRSAVPGEGEAAVDRPWWETDPGRLGSHRLAREYGERLDP